MMQRAEGRGPGNDAEGRSFKRKTNWRDCTVKQRHKRKKKNKQILMMKTFNLDSLEGEEKNVEKWKQTIRKRRRNAGEKLCVI